LNEHHDRSAFSSGVADLDRYFQTQASQDARRKVAATFVLISDKTGIVGFYTLSAHSIRLSELPDAVAKRLPKYPAIPVTLLGRLAVGLTHQGQKLGQFLLLDALRRSLENTKQIGSVGVVVDALNETASRFYLHHDFTPLPGYDRKLFLPMSTISKLIGESLGAK
jgi:GNAT superfamily N-acetyltransferase